MQSTPSETSSAGIFESTKMDIDSMKNGIEQNEAPIDQEETHLTESKVLLNGSAYKEHAECDSNELNNDIIHGNNVNTDPVVINSVNDINVDEKNDPTNESNRDEKVFPLDPEESPSENTVSSEESKSSVGETTLLKPEVTQDPKSSVEETQLKPEVTQELKSSVGETATLTPEDTHEPKSSVGETAPLNLEDIQEPESSAERTATLKPEVTLEPKSLEEEAPLKPEVIQEPKSPVVETAPLKPEVTPEPESSVGETAPLKPEVTHEPESSVGETAPLKPEVTPEPESSVGETAPLKPEVTHEPESSVGETAPLKPEVTHEPESSVGETAPLEPEVTQELNSSLGETAPLKPEITQEPNSSSGETAPLKPEITQEADKNMENVPGTLKEDDVKEPEEPMDILGNGLLLKKVLKEGKGRMSRPTHGQRVALRTEGKLENGTIVDKNDRIEFILGDGDVISAWDIAVALMGENEIAELKCDAKYAYGSVGRSPGIPENATITYTLELLGKENGPDYSFMTIDERMYHGSLKKERGNYLFTRSDYRGAINSYLKAISIIDNDNVTFEEPPQKLQQLLEDKIKCYNNLAAAQLKVDYYDAAIKSCEGVLKHHPENVKALFRMGKAYAAKGETKEAIVQMKKALKLEPETKIIHQELSKLTKKLSKETQSERNMYKKMFRTTDTPVKPSVEHSRWKWPVIAGSLAVVLLSVGVAYFRYKQH